jgi:hypothetical protein
MLHCIFHLLFELGGKAFTPLRELSTIQLDSDIFNN